MKNMNFVDWFMILAPLAEAGWMFSEGVWPVALMALALFCLTFGGAVMGYRWR